MRFGIFFTILTVGLSWYEFKLNGTTQTSEMFNTAGRNVGVGLTAAVIVSQWTWAATLLMSSNMGCAGDRFTLPVFRCLRCILYYL